MLVSIVTKYYMNRGLKIPCLLYYHISTETNSVKEVDIKNCTSMLSMIWSISKIVSSYPNKMKIDKKSNEIILIYYVGYVTLNSVKPLYLTVNKVNGYIRGHNGSKYLTLVHTDKSKGARKMFKELWKKIKDLIDQQVIARTIMMKKYMKIRFTWWWFTSNDDLPLISVIIYWDVLMFYEVFFSPQVKPNVIISNKHGVY